MFEVGGRAFPVIPDDGVVLGAARVSDRRVIGGIGVGSSVGDAVEFADLAGLSRQERVERLRRRMAAVPVRGESRRARVEDVDGQLSVEVLPVPGPLAELLPRRGLARGAVVAHSGADSVLLGLVAAVTAGGGHAVVLGRPRLGLVAAVEMGAELSRLALVPDPGADPIEIAAILLDGMDLVVLGLDGASVTPSRARAVVARARSKGCALIVTGGQWPGPDLRLDGQVVSYTGLGIGTGRVRGLRLDVNAQGRGFGPVGRRLDLRADGGSLEWATVAADRVKHTLEEAVSW